MLLRVVSASRLICAASVLLFVRSADAAPAAFVTAPFSGITYTHRTQVVPRPLSIHILEIDLIHPDIRFQLSPSNGNAPLENTRQTTRQFVNSVGAQIGINASFYSTSGAYATNWGLVASQGDVYSLFDTIEEPWPVLNISQDNVAEIVNRSFSHAGETDPVIPLYNAVSGSERIVTGGVNTAGAVAWGQPLSLHPRTVAGITADHKLVLMVVDGRQTGFSQGMTSFETANLLIQYGVVDAINLDGGGSSTMVLARPNLQVLNSPSDGSERSVATSLAVFAASSTIPRDTVVFSDFFGGDRGTFTFAPTYSGSTQGILSTSSNTVVQSSDAVDRGWHQRLVIHDNPAISSVSQNPDGGWFVRHISGTGATQSQNVSRSTTGYVGFWARTEVEGIYTSIAIDDADNTTADRGIRRALIADDQWHLYQWNLDDNDQWEGWVNGDGIIDTATFTLDSLQFFGPNVDAVIDIDMISHNALGMLAPLVLPGDFDGDGDVDGADFVVWQTNFPRQNGATLSTGDADGDGDVDGADFVVWQTNFPASAHAGAAAAAPEPAAVILAGLGIFGLVVCRHKQHNHRCSARSTNRR